MTREITVALVGNPNSGKTTVFNNLTGAHHYVGNWPGVTVEKKEGTLEYQGHRLRVIDLPGVYSLTAYSLDEIIARNFVINDKPDVVVDIVDASSLERNLYLTLQLLETGARVVLALNMMDQAESKGYVIDVPGLSRLLMVPVVPMSANRNRGTADLLKEIVNVADRKISMEPLRIQYGHEIEEEIANLEQLISHTDLSHRYSPRWLAVKLLEEDEEIIKEFRE
jgi:small GTP-binding protein